MKGPLHERLQKALQEATAKGTATQDSLSRATNGGKTQTGFGKYLQGKGGALDLDEAEIALRHIGSSLQDFLNGLPPRELTPDEIVCRDLLHRAALLELVKALLEIKKPQLPAVLELIRTFVLPATGPHGPRTRGSRSAPTRARRTTKEPAKRR